MAAFSGRMVGRAKKGMDDAKSDRGTVRVECETTDGRIE
jgi:hypothetical protein